MNVHPVLAALFRHKASALLIAVEIALTLAIVCNALFIIQKRVEGISRPTGLNEKNLFLVSQTWVDAPKGNDPSSIAKLDAMLQADVATLRRLPDVESVSNVLSLPLLNSSWDGGVTLKPDQRQPTAHVSYYFVGDDILRTLGVRLITGRDFNAGDYTNRGFRGKGQAPVTIITKALADRLFPDGNAVGKSIYLDSTAPTMVIGVIARLQIPSTESWANGFTWYSALIPTRLDANFSRYAVRAKPGRLQHAMREARPALYAANPMRVIDDSVGPNNGIRSFADIRTFAYRADLGVAEILAAICIILLGMTAAGIVGLTSFWVEQRHKQIGVRRALGARKIDILHYFQLENLLIVGFGTVAGIAMTFGLNVGLMTYFEINRIPVSYVFLGVVVVAILGQAAVYFPARRASNVSPASAISVA